MFRKKITGILILVCSAVALSSSAQSVHFNFYNYLYNKPIHKSASGLDSVYGEYLHFPFTGKPQNYRYTGQLKNGLPDGIGTFIVGYNGMIKYAGEWKEGMPHGTGTFENHDLYHYAFRGEFIKGKPVNGLVVYGYDDHFKPTIFYSGDVSFDPGNPLKLVPHGYGTMYVALNASDNSTVPGSFCEGQFHYGKPTGFSVYNKNAYRTSLQAGLLMAGVEVKQFSDLGFHADVLEGNWKIPAEGTSVIKQLLPDINKAVFDTLNVNIFSTYYGFTLNGLPYGPGTVVYKDGFRDPGFWKNGEQISPRSLLAALLPDSSVLTPVTRIEMHPVFKLVVNKRKRTEEWVVSYEKKPVNYYAPWVSGQPVGYGWKVDSGTNAIPVAAEFTGNRNEKEWNAELSFAQAPAEYARSKGYTNGLEWFRGISFETFSGTSYPVAFKKDGTAAYYDSVRFRGVQFRPTASLFEPTMFSKSMQEYRKKESAKIGIYNSILNKRPKAYMRLITFYPGDISRTQITTASGTLKGSMMPKAAIQAGDNVLVSGGKFALATEAGMAPGYAIEKNGFYYIVRDYTLEESFSESFCSACNGTGGSSTTKSAQVSFGSTASVNYNLPNYSNGALVFTPKYTTIGVYTVKNTCNVCKGKAYSKTNTTRVEIKY
ncbi:hypothetical protein [Sediminibacterium ginsengisoli]|uniref:MORN repeat-containing protein n=1 Tax=Sediminibacterium ginsengisoli TaxID=413434 RepID=A0A1T4P794_9BACT|nr:hypothetical protein [Sediminibacterium ginsengisoli]SJZ87445.1 MORN repeat-containing protein [Sediminibacterium ginsengisoli]